jgi:hypothetical protein
MANQRIHDLSKIAEKLQDNTDLGSSISLKHKDPVSSTLRLLFYA